MRRNSLDPSAIVSRTPVAAGRAAPTGLSGLLPTRTELVPWTDRRGRLHPLRAAVFGLLLLPALWLAARWALHWLGPEPVHAAILSTGYWTVWLLVASLAVTPLKALGGQPNVVVVRRMVGNAAVIYALLHLTFYCTDENWRMLTVVSEILKRFYLTIGFVALLGLLALGLTSTDGWVRALGRNWKRLHKLVYGLMVLGLVHYVLQSKLDVSQALLATGVFSWTMLWRMLPAGRDRGWIALTAISVAAAALTLGYEYLWYRFGTHVNPMKVVLLEFDTDYGLHPAGQVLLLGAVVTAVAELRRLSMSAFGSTVLFTAIVYAVGAFADDAAALFNGWSYDGLLPDGWSPWLLDVPWVLVLGLLGVARWRMRDRSQRRLIDGLMLACVAFQVVLVGIGDPNVGAAAAGVVAVAAVLLAARLWLLSRGTALLLAPLCAFLMVRAATLF